MYIVLARPPEVSSRTLPSRSGRTAIQIDCGERDGTSHDHSRFVAHNNPGSHGRRRRGLPRALPTRESTPIPPLGPASTGAKADKRKTGRSPRMKRLHVLAFVGSLAAGMSAMAASAAEKVVIGDIDDMSGPYADVLGAERRRSGQDGDRRLRRLRPRPADRAVDRSTTRTSPTSARRRRANGPTRTA